MVPQSLLYSVVAFATIVGCDDGRGPSGSIPEAASTDSSAVGASDVFAVDDATYLDSGTLDAPVTDQGERDGAGADGQTREGAASDGATLHQDVSDVGGTDASDLDRAEPDAAAPDAHAPDVQHPDADPLVIALMGESTVSTRYLPEEQRAHTVLQAHLAADRPDEEIEVINIAQDGEFCGSLLHRGRYDDLRDSLGRVDVAIVRYGQNDWKYMGPRAFGIWQEELYDQLEADFPGITIVVETGQYFDPAHFRSDTNERNQLWWDETRAVATRRDYLLSDHYQRMVDATAAGRWDLRRRIGGRLDDSEDHLHEGDREWFSEGHPNLDGVRLAAEGQRDLLAEAFPDELPRAEERAPGQNAGRVRLQPGLTVLGRCDACDELSEEAGTGRVWVQGVAVSASNERPGVLFTRDREASLIRHGDVHRVGFSKVSAHPIRFTVRLNEGVTAATLRVERVEWRAFDPPRE